MRKDKTNIVFYCILYRIIDNVYIRLNISFRKKNNNNNNTFAASLTVSFETKSIASLPVFTPRTTHCFISTVATFAESASFTPGGSQPTHFTVFVRWCHDPVDAGIVADDFVLWIDKNNFEIFERSILVDPVRVQDTEIATETSDTLLTNTAKITAHLQLVNTVVFGFTVHNTFVVLTLATTTTDSNTVHHVSLFGFVTKTASFVWASWVSQFDNLVALTVKNCEKGRREKEKKGEGQKNERERGIGPVRGGRF